MTNHESEHVIPVAFDVPDHQQEQTSSIGNVGEPGPASFGRLKGFYQGIVDTDMAYREAKSQFESGRRLLHEHNGYSRLQYRAIFDYGLLRHYIHDLYPWVEVVIPLDSGQLGISPVLLYLSENTLNRQSCPEDLALIRENLILAQKAKPRVVSTILQRARERGYVVDILSLNERENKVVQNQIADLYVRFGWSGEDVVTMLNNQNNIIAVARFNGQIVSSGIGEMVSVSFGRNELRLAELTEAATLGSYERQGCYASISTVILLELYRRSEAHEIFGGKIDLAFGESNGLSVGVLHVAAIQGRSFSTDAGERYGLYRSGILHQQVPISGPTRQTPYNDLIVTYFTRQDLNKFALYG